MASSEPVRLQKVLAQAGIASRRAAEKLITDGHVRVNGRIVRELGTKVVPGKDEISCDGVPLEAEERQIYLFYKPKGVVTTLRDPQGRPTVQDYLKDVPVRVYPVGRLDFDVAGLLVLTNDGDFANELMHPRYGVERTYWAVVQGRPDEEDLASLRRGVRIGGAPAKAKHAALLEESMQTRKIFGALRQGQQIIELTVIEGRNHFVKRVLAAIDHPVKKLCRVSFGPYRLGALRPGEVTRVKAARERRARLRGGS